MKFLNYTTVLLMYVALSVSPAYAAGMEGMQDMPGMMKDTTRATNDQLHKGKGTIESIDRNQRAITINHQPIKSIGWSAMTMAFSVKDEAALTDLAPGQMVDFELVLASNGRYLITRITPAKPDKQEKPRMQDMRGHMMEGMMGHMMGMMMDHTNKDMSDICPMMAQRDAK